MVVVVVVQEKGTGREGYQTHNDRSVGVYRCDLHVNPHVNTYHMYGLERTPVRVGGGRNGVCYPEGAMLPLARGAGSEH